MSEVQRWIDQKVGNVALKLFKKRNNKFSLNKNSKILVIKNKSIGDSIYILPLLRELNKEFDCEIDVLCDTSNKLVFKSHKFINELIELTIPNVFSKRKHYDLVIDTEPWSNISAILSRLLGKNCVGFSHSERSELYNKTIKYSKNQHIVKTYLDFFKLFSKKTPIASLEKLHVSTKTKTSAKKFYKKNTIGLAVGVSGNAKGRMWASHRWNLLIKEINEHFPSYEVILLGVKEDFDIAEEIIEGTTAKNLHGKTNLDELFEIIKNCKAFIGCDSGPIHIAASQGVKTIGLFGPNTPTIWAPYGKGNVSIWHKNPGVPTIDNTDPYFIENKESIAAEKKAMNEIGVKEVFDHLRKMLR